MTQEWVRERADPKQDSEPVKGVAEAEQVVGWQVGEPACVAGVTDVLSAFGAAPEQWLAAKVVIASGAVQARQCGRWNIWVGCGHCRNIVTSDVIAKL